MIRHPYNHSLFIFINNSAFTISEAEIHAIIMQPMQIEDEKSVKEEGLIKNESDQRELMDEEIYQNQIDLSSNESATYKRQKRQHGERSNKSIDLNTQSFEGIVSLCKSEGLISQEMAHSFFRNHTPNMDKRYIELLQRDELDQYKFDKCKINIIDHRRLVDMLISHRPNKYIPLHKPEQPYDFIPEVRIFLKGIYQLPAINYEVMVGSQANRFYQSWWGGPKYVSPVVDPPVRFSETQEGRKKREQKENCIRIVSQEEERQRMRRINQQRATPNDLLDIAKLMKQKLYGNKPRQLEPKIEPSEVSSVASIADSAASKASLKDKKEKKEKKEKKQKKEKKKGKKKKDKKDKEIKKEDGEESKPENDGASSISSKSKSKKKKKGP